MKNPARDGNGRTMFIAGAACAGLAYGLIQIALSASPALAQVPDSGAQRNAMITELQRSNEYLSQIVNLLKEERDAAKASASKSEGAKKP